MSPLTPEGTPTCSDRLLVACTEAYFPYVPNGVAINEENWADTVTFVDTKSLRMEPAMTSLSRTSSDSELGIE